MLGAQQPSPNQTRPLHRAQHERLHRQRLHIVVQLAAQVIALARIVHQDDLLEQRPRRPVDHAPDGAQQRRPRLIVEHNDDGRGRQLVGIMLQLAVRIPHVGQ